MSIQVKSKFDRNQCFHYYYDLDVINNSVNGFQSAVPFKFIETRNQPFLNCPENYYMSVVRFTLQSPNLPVFIPSIELGQSDPNRTVYRIFLQYDYIPPAAAQAPPYNIPPFNGLAGAPITFTSPDSTQPTPAAPLIKQDLSSTYYYVYSYIQWTSMVNNGFNDTLTALKALWVVWQTANAAQIALYNAAFPLAQIPTGALNVQLLPILEFSPVELTATLNLPSPAYDQYVAGYTANCYFNESLYNLYNNLPFEKLIKLVNSAQTTMYKVLASSFGGFNIFNLGSVNPVPYVQCYQEGSTISLLNPISSIVFTTGLLPINPEIVGVPVSNNVGGIQSNSGAANLSPVMTDFQVPFNALNTYKPNITYTPTGEYRLVDLIGTSPLNSIQISVFWKDYFGNLNPFYLGAGCAGNIKILFRRKDYDSPPSIFD
jgi:hypothetical protein